MIVDCNGCVMRDIACGDCVVTALLGPVNVSISAHKDTFDVLAGAGLIPPLRLVPGLPISDDVANEAVGL